MAAIGETLRQARLRLGVDLNQVADRTKISVRFLQAIEGRFWQAAGRRLRPDVRQAVRR